MVKTIPRPQSGLLLELLLLCCFKTKSVAHASGTKLDQSICSKSSGDRQTSESHSASSTSSSSSSSPTAPGWWSSYNFIVTWKLAVIRGRWKIVQVGTKLLFSLHLAPTKSFQPHCWNSKWKSYISTDSKYDLFLICWVSVLLQKQMQLVGCSGKMFNLEKTFTFTAEHLRRRACWPSSIYLKHSQINLKRVKKILEIDIRAREKWILKEKKKNSSWRQASPVWFRGGQS